MRSGQSARNRLAYRARPVRADRRQPPALLALPIKTHPAQNWIPMALQSVSAKAHSSSREDLLAAATRLRTEVGKRIVGQEAVVEEILIALLAGGHVLLVGVPGLAKTLMIRSVSEAMDLDFKRIQFTPDLVPSDITGTEIMEEDSATGARSFRFVRGPVFANILLADEINRAPPRTQAALLEAMQEHRVTAAGETMFGFVIDFRCSAILDTSLARSATPRGTVVACFNAASINASPFADSLACLYAFMTALYDSASASIAAFSSSRSDASLAIASLSSRSY